jgi:hypothetical protein
MSAKTLTAREALRIEYGHSRNMLTPDVIRVGKLSRDLAFELSTGSGIEQGTTLYGVSLVRIIDHDAGRTERDYERSQVFHSLEDAEAYLESLRAPRYRVVSASGEVLHETDDYAGACVAASFAADKRRAFIDVIDYDGRQLTIYRPSCAGAAS